MLATTFLFTINILHRGKEHELNILGLDNLPEVDPLGCVKVKESFEGWIWEEKKSESG